jgi:two-component sensor histidine kinase
MVSNAIRHGAATSISLVILRDSPDTIRITAANNGRGVDKDHRPGLGMSMYDELCAEWHMVASKQTTVVALIAARGNKLDHTTFEKTGSTRRAP